ncbi:MAG: RDD family protein, partial [Candidatus Limnocylindrales bacterium]
SSSFSALFAPDAFVSDPATGRLVATPATIAAIDATLGSIVGLVVVLAVGGYLIQSLYFGLLWSRRGASIGQELLGLEVRRQADGTRISFRRGCLRVLGYALAAASGYFGFIFVVLDPRKQGWHDKIAGTVVIKPVAGRLHPAPPWLVLVALVGLGVGLTGTIVALDEFSSRFPSTTGIKAAPQNVPPVSAIWFGDSFNPSTFGLNRRSTTFSMGQSVALVAHLARDLANERIGVHTIIRGIDRVVASFVFVSPGDLCAVNLSGTDLNLTGQVDVVITDSSGDVLAVSTFTLR